MFCFFDLRLISVLHVLIQSGAFKLTKEGFLLLQFAPAAGVRQYDWSRKQVWFLSFNYYFIDCDRNHDFIW